MMEDLITEYSIENITESDFINKVNNEMTIDKEFVRMFIRKNDENFENFKYRHDEVAKFLGYEVTDNCKHFITMMKKELRESIDFIAIINCQDTLRSADRRRPQQIPLEDIKKCGKKCGKKVTFQISRIGFYMLCMVANQMQKYIEDNLDHYMNLQLIM